MARVTAENYGFCQTPDGRSIPCNQLPGDGLAQLALMLRGSRMMDLGYGGNGSGRANTILPVAANGQRPAYENSWASIADNSGPFAPRGHRPITMAQDILIAPSQPYVDTIPWRPGYLPFPPRPMPFPPGSIPLPPRIGPFPVPQDIPIPFIDRNELKGNEDDYEPRPVPDDGECEEQWSYAAADCAKKKQALKDRSGGRYVDFDMTACMRALVSEACGGLPVDWGKWGPPLQA